jgi:hypothetical protein
MASTVSNINMTMNTTRLVVEDREEIPDLSEVNFLPRIQSKRKVSERKVVEIVLSDEDEIDEVIILNQRSRPRLQWSLPLLEKKVEIKDYSGDDEIEEIIIPERPRFQKVRQVSENIPDYSSSDEIDDSFPTVNYTKSTIFVRGDNKSKWLKWIDDIERRVAIIISTD